ncbi:MAG: hypothetical protein AAGB18_03145 [Pseudomonadota bacterium]
MTSKILSALIVFGLSASAVSASTLVSIKTDGGKIIASGANKMTLYTFRNDAPNTSACYGDCAEAWPPFLASASEQPEGALGIILRRDGARQWVLDGKPLYFWAGDDRPGDVTGDGVGGVWDAVRR